MYGYQWRYYGAKYKITLTLVDADDDNVDRHVDDIRPSNNRFDDSVVHDFSAFNHNN